MAHQAPKYDASQFQAGYQFKISNQECVISTTYVSPKGNNFMRVHRGDGKGEGSHLNARADLHGEFPFQRFRVELLNGNLMKFKSTLTNKYVRIKPLGRGVDCDGNGGKFCEFLVHKEGGGRVKLQSNSHRGTYSSLYTHEHIHTSTLKLGKYLTVTNDGELKPGAGTFFMFFRRQIKPQGGGHQPHPNPPPVVHHPQGAFSNHYAFAKINTVCIRYPDNNKKRNGFLRVSPQNKQQLDVNGVRGGPLTQFLAIPKGNVCAFKSIAGGGYLRIIGNTIDCGGNPNGKFTEFKVHAVGNGKVKLESNVPNLKGKYVAVQGQNNINIGGGGQWTVMEIFRKN